MKPRFFELAKRIAIHSDHDQHKLGCVVVRKNRVVSVGFNMMKTHPQSIHFYKYLHAEISALIGLDYEVSKGCVAYVYRGHKDGRPAIAKPCKACQIALKLAGIKKVFYTYPNEQGWSEYGV